jgi:hypothetical protein
MNSLAASKEQLIDSLRQLTANWNSAKDIWNDAARQAFEKEFVTEFETTTAASIDRLQELIDTLAQAERELP